jgi:hypothetical protein
MKKMLFLCALVCAGMLNAMENTEPKSSFYLLLPELRHKIITMALESSTTPDEAIDKVKVLSIIQGVSYDKLFSNLKDFTIFVNFLAEKFNTTTEKVAVSCDLPIGSTYHNLLLFLINASNFRDDIQRVKSLIAQGADINGSISSNNKILTPLSGALERDTKEIAKFLISAGAQPKNLTPAMQKKYEALKQQIEENLVQESHE